jgi:hypothetical protein
MSSVSYPEKAFIKRDSSLIKPNLMLEGHKVVLAHISYTAMQIHTDNHLCFQYTEESGAAGSLSYHDEKLQSGIINSSGIYKIRQLAAGTWVVELLMNKEDKLISTIKTDVGGSMSITKFYRRKKYYFKKSQNLKLRFSLFNKDNEELLTIIPLVNWQKKSHDFVLQVNEEFEKECDSLLILQALHCALCFLSMMTGGEVQALISI